MTDWLGSSFLDVLPPIMLAATGLVLAALIAARRHRLGAGQGRTGPEHNVAPVNPSQADRIESLQVLLATVDEKIAELRRLQAAATPEAHHPLPPTGNEGRVTRVLRLHEEGLDNIEISRRLGVEVGEVELTLNLYRHRPAQAR